MKNLDFLRPTKKVVLIILILIILFFIPLIPGIYSSSCAGCLSAGACENCVEGKAVYFLSLDEFMEGVSYDYNVDNFYYFFFLFVFILLYILLSYFFNKKN